MKIRTLPAWFAGLFLLLPPRGDAMAGVACVIAKEQGDSRAIEWVHAPGPADVALERAKRKLRQRGYRWLFPQVTAGLEHAYVIIIRSDYKNARGRDRTSYGCGFSEKSYDEALWAAIRNLQSYAWGWKPDREGYKIHEKNRF